MIPYATARTSGAKLAFAHRWADCFNESVGGCTVLLETSDGSCCSDSDWVPIVECPLSHALGLESWMVSAAQSLVMEWTGAPGSNDFDVRSVGAESTCLHGWQAFCGTLPKTAVRLVTFVPTWLPTNERHVGELAKAHWNALIGLEESMNIKVQNRAMVQQVTQDFEELTWLRGVSQQIGVADIKDPMLDVATSQLPMLRNVIQSELIALVPSELLEPGGPLDVDQIAFAGNPPCDWSQVIEFLRCCTARSDTATLVFNVQTVANLFEPFPEIRNCIVARIEKQGRSFGYLVAINREIDFLGTTPEDFVNFDPNGIQFGTFEAGLLIVLSTVLASHATNVELFQEQENLLTGVIRAVINAIDAKDAYTCGHSDRVAEFARAIGRRMGLDEKECERVYLTGLLHDVGKIGVPDSILSKPDKLTDDEYDVVKKHPEIGFQILQHLAPLKDVLPGVLHHHEAINGTGYPMGLSGSEIPLRGRILAVADAYDAMTSNRPYRLGMPTEKAEAILKRESGVIWDESAVCAMLECIEHNEVIPQSSGIPQVHSHQYVPLVSINGSNARVGT